MSEIEATKEIEVSLKRTHPDSADESTGEEHADAESAEQESGRPDGVGPLVNQDRLEKKKNREKRRRSEVNERFEELISVMESAQAQMLNAPYSGDFSKGVLTKAGLLEKAVDLVKQLSEENKKLKMVMQGGVPMQMMQGPGAIYDPAMMQHSWMAPQRAQPQHSGFGGPPPAVPMGMAGPNMMDYSQFVAQQRMMAAPPAAMVGGPFKGNKATVLSFGDMAQLGYGNHPSYGQMKQELPPHPDNSRRAVDSSTSHLSTHAECA